MTKSITQSLSLWMASADMPVYAPLRENTTADICIVGAGMAGLCTAYLLAKDGWRVVVLTQEGVGQGESMRTTAHLTAALDNRYFSLEALHGQLGAQLAASSHIRAIDRFEEIIQEEQIDCSFNRVDGYLVPHSKEDIEEINLEYKAAGRTGMQVEIIDHCPVPSFSIGPYLRFPQQAQFHPMEFMAGITHAIERMGGHIYTDTHVDTVTGGMPVKVQATSGPTVTANAAVVATDTPISNILVLHTKQAAYRTYVIAAPIPADSLKLALYWDTDDPYHYVRIHTVLSHNRATDMLIVGGEDHKTGQANDTVDRYARLEEWMRKHFPMAGEVDYCWSGQIMEPYDGLAFIGPNPLDENVYVATGTSGNGMTYGMITGTILSDLIAKRHNVWATLYNPSRITLRAATDYASENLNVARKYMELITPAEVSSEAEIPCNSGAVIRHGLQKQAVYRDENGVLYRFSAVCSHLNCIVHWNAAEKTWDCPCHGSRYSRFGKVINGPTVKGLEPIE